MTPVGLFALVGLAGALFAISAPAAAQSTGETAGLSAAADSRGFSTRYAKYQAAEWKLLPGWQEESVTEAFSAFAKGCSVLARKEAWALPCERSRRLRADDAGAARSFFEENFDLLQIRQIDNDDRGTITGYFEPLLRGSRQRQGAFVYPVYAVPNDLLYLDARTLEHRDPGQPLLGRVNNQVVELVPPSSGAVAADPRLGLYRVDVESATPDLRDRRVRMRIEGDRIVPYPPRQEIERAPLRAARVIVWVDSADALYSMQVQGSGKIRMADGTVIRLAFAEQNGHAFIPKVIASNATGVRTRGLTGLQQEAEVQRLIDYFLNQQPRAAAADGPGKARPGAAKEAASKSARDDAHAPGLNDIYPVSQPGSTGLGASDPSYVFFREIPDGPDGPIGALGVPLTAGRSIAVDPRVTPLGTPVFISSSGGSGDARSVNRLMVAQDTGGAIRGPVRADYFWGFGRQAGTRAFQMKDDLKMWLLVPKGMELISKFRERIRTRGIDGQAAAECLIADDELCVE